jgi:hypothetical protein
MFNFIKNAQHNQRQIYLNPNINVQQNIQQNIKNSIFNKNMNYYVCSFGGCGSTILFKYLSNFGNVYHIHDRFPSDKLKYVGKNNTDEDIYSEWFNNVEINESEITKYKVIFIYRNPLKVIYSRYINAHGPNKSHLQHIMCDNNGNISLRDVLRTNTDLYKMEEFFDNYTKKKERNYKIHCVKYEQFWDNISLFNKTLDIPDIKQLYPIRHENNKKIYHIDRLYSIYFSLINKMNKMKFIEII